MSGKKINNRHIVTYITPSKSRLFIIQFCFMPTKLIRSLNSIESAAQGGVVTIGNFDGVHLGHQALLRQVVKQAKTRRAASTVITFEPHPFEFFAGDKLAIPRLTRLREKFSRIRLCGVDNVIILKFNQQLANLSASDFVYHLYQALHPCHMVIGDDFRFGQKRQGDFVLLQAVGKELGFTVSAMPSYLVDGERVSSTLIRQALAEDNLARAGKLMGRPYTMQGRVCHGDKLGKQLGCPTANIYLHRRLTPIKGIFTVKVHGLAEKPLPGVANIGTRPTVGGTCTLLEVHLLDFNQNIYARYVEVEFCQKLREEERYSSLDLLKEQIAKDVAAAKQYFKVHHE